MTTTFFRLLSATDKGSALIEAVRSSRQNRPSDSVFAVDPASFRKVPNAPFAYWVGEEIRDLFVKLPPFEGEGRTARVGLQTSDDFRFVRAWWEVPAERMLDAANGPDWREDLEGFQAWCRKRTRDGKYWVPFAKGGEYSPYYADIHLVVNWKNEGEDMSAFKAAVIRNPQYYFRPGLTWPRRTNSRFGVYILPAGAIFGDKGPAAFADTPHVPVLLGTMFSSIFDVLINLYMAGGDETQSGTPSRSYEVGVIQILPFPKISDESRKLCAEQVIPIADFARKQVAESEGSFVFQMDNLKEVTSARQYSIIRQKRILGSIEALLHRFFEINRLISNAYGLAEDYDRAFDDLGNLISAATRLPEFTELDEMFGSTVYDSIQALLQRSGGKRQLAVKSYYVSRKLEMLCRFFNCSIADLVSEILNRGLLPKADYVSAGKDLLSLMLGVAFSSFDVRNGLPSLSAHETTAQFDPLPVCPPSSLVGTNGLPATPGTIVSEEWLRVRAETGRIPAPGAVKNPTIRDDEYPITLCWDGLLVDDPGHPNDIIGRMRSAMHYIWKDKADVIEHEACETLGVKELRQYFRSSSGFFADHLQRYSKSRRKAPIYWPLSTPSGSYTLWIYYPRLNESTLFRCVNEYLSPKLEQLEKEVAGLRKQEAAMTGGEQQRIEELQDLARELSGLKAELLRVTGLPYKPDLDDGVMVCAAPLASLFGLGKWRKDLDEVWLKLERGDYDWAHLAYAIWPDRVREKCCADRSLAIAHGLEELCGEKHANASPPAGRKRKVGKK